MTKVLMPHQRETIRYARTTQHPAVFHQMRLGKTLPTIRRCKMYTPRGNDLRVLVVAPNSALGSWERELLDDGETDLVFLQGARAERIELLRSGMRWNLINKEGWMVTPEIGNRRYCDTCAGQGTRRTPTGTSVINVKTERCDVRIDRTSKWGNPFLIKRGQPRARVIKMYRDWIKTQQQLLDALPELLSLRLGCHCKPLACHGDVLLSMLRASMPMQTCLECGGIGNFAMVPEYFWDAVVLDESTFVKSPHTQITKFFLRNFRDVPHRWALTGMPNPEGPLDLWCQLAWLDGRALGCGSYWQFRARHFQPGPAGFGWEQKLGTAEMIQRGIAERAFCLRRQDAGMRTPKVYERREVELPKKLRETYREAKRLFILEYDGQEVARTVWATQRWHWLRQLCAGFVGKRLVWPGKINELASLVTGELAGEQCIVWFAYNAELRACAKVLRERRVHAEVMLSETKPEDRRELERHFRRGWFRVFLIQEAVAETGLDLSTADTAIYFSNHPGLQARAQSEDRLVHPAKSSPCLYIDLVVRDSVEEVVAEQLSVKKWRSQRLIERAVMQQLRERRTA